MEVLSNFISMNFFSSRFDLSDIKSDISMLFTGESDFYFDEDDEYYLLEEEG